MNILQKLVNSGGISRHISDAILLVLKKTFTIKIWATEQNAFHNSISNIKSESFDAVTSFEIGGNLSHVMNKTAFCICKNKGADQLRSTLAGKTTRLISINSICKKFQVSS